jgi:Bacterial DNA-binding protein
MAPRTPKDPETKPAKPKSVAKPVAKAKPAAKPAAAKPSKPALKVVEKVAPGAAATAGMMRLKDLVETVAAATGGKKPEVKKTVEATLAAIGTALAASQSLALPPLGKLRVAKATGGALTLKLRLADASKAAGIALADDQEDE